MALAYQKAYKVRDGSLESLESFYTSKGEEACKDVGGTWYAGKCVLSAESPSAEKYNKLAKAFNDRLTNGAGDPTWRLFFYAHSLTRSIIKPPVDAPIPGIGFVSPDYTNTMDGTVKRNHHEDFWWKFYSHIELNPFGKKAKQGIKGEFREFGQYFWPNHPLGQPGGANPANPLVSYVLGTGKNGANVDNNWHDGRKMPPEWFRLGMVPISLYAIKPEFNPYVSEYPLFLFPEIEADPVDLSSLTKRHNPVTITEKWIMAKLQRGVCGIVSVDGVSVTNKLRAEAPAYFAPRIYHKFDYHWRSPHGKYAPSYTPTADVIGYCPSSDPRFPPSPIYKYTFKPINEFTHSKLQFSSDCSGSQNSVLKVRRKYDHYEIEFVGGYHYELVDLGGGRYSFGKAIKGPLKLPYKYYLEGSYEGGGKIEKREAYHDQIDQISNYFNSGFRKTPEMAKAQKGSDFNSNGQLNYVYSSVGEATFDLPSFNFEFEKFFRKQYSLAPAFGGFQAISTKDGEIPKMVPKYPRFGVKLTNVTTTSSTPVSSLASNGALPVWQKDLNGYGSYKNLGYTGLISVPNFCIAGYYLWGVGIQIKSERVSGEVTTTGNTLNFKIKKTKKWSSTSTTVKDISISVNAIADSGPCYDSQGNLLHSGGTLLDCLTEDGRTFLQDGWFQKMYYFDAGEEIADSMMEVELLNSSQVEFLSYIRGDFPSAAIAPAVPQIFFELAHVLQYKPDLPDALTLLRCASTGEGSKIEEVSDQEGVWFGPIETGADSRKSRGIGLDTRGKDMNVVDSPESSPRWSVGDRSATSFDIWDEYNTFGYIPNVMGALELPDKMSEQFDVGTMDATSFLYGKEVPINFNPVYESARKLYGDNLRMIPRTQFVDYRVEEDCKFCSNEYYTTESSCKNAGYQWGGMFVRDKSVLTFERYVNGMADGALDHVDLENVSSIAHINEAGDESLANFIIGL